MQSYLLVLLGLLACVALCSGSSVPSVLEELELVPHADEPAFSGIGDRLWRTFIVFHALPLTVSEAIDQGYQNWTQSCHPDLGTGYAHGEGPTKSHPLVPYYTKAGQISGLAVVHWGDIPAALQGTWWTPTGTSGVYMVNLSFRSSSMMCSGSTSSAPVGDRLVINQQSQAMHLPLNVAEAQKDGWTKGGCIGRMGTHWSYDLATHPTMSWNVSSLLPVVLMFNGDAPSSPISAFFFASNTVQVLGTEPLGPWEGPIPGDLMCLNWCNSNCASGFNDPAWSTLHVMLTNPDNNECASRCPSAQEEEEEETMHAW